MKATPYNKVQYSIQPGVMFRDSVLNAFLSEDGGIVLGNMIALAGTKGAGKTTLCKKLQKELPEDMNSVFFSLETGKGSLQRQTKRVVAGDHAKICDDNDYPTWNEFMSDLHKYVPTMVIVDSLQHAAKLLTKENGKFKYDNYAQIVEDLYNWKEKHNTIVILIVQLNSQGKVEGPEATVFDVDCPLKLTANPKTKERFLEAEKNRMGGTIGEPIFYEFVGDDRVIQFYTEDEYRIIKQGVTLSTMIQNTIESYLAVYKNHDNYKSFKKEFKKGYENIYNSGIEDILIVAQTLVLIDALAKKYF
jgi:predicted ATP-dependent serine protease